MGEGMLFATLATMVGKKFAARWGDRRVTIGAVGTNKDGRWVMGTFADGGVVLGQPEDFTIPGKYKPKPTHPWRVYREPQRKA